MTLRQKSIVIMGTTLVGLIIASFAVLPGILLPGFDKLEREKTLRDIQRFKAVYDQDLQELSQIAWDWAHGYGDRHGLPPTFREDLLESEIPGLVFKRLHLDTMALVIPSQKTVKGKAHDRFEGVEGVLPESLGRFLGDSLFGGEGAGSGHVARSGIIVLSEGLLLGALQPIPSPGGDGETQGSLFLGRYLDVQKFSAAIKGMSSSLHFRPWASDHLPRDFEDAREHLASVGDYAAVLNPDVMSGYTVVSDLWGKPALLVRVDADRAIYRQGQSTTRFLVFSFLLMAVLFNAVTLILSEKWVLSRLVRLSRAVKDVGEKGLQDKAVCMAGNDEVSQLGGAINEMLRSTQDSQARLREVLEDLKESERRYRELSDLLPQIVFEIDLEGNLTFSNRAAFDLFGYTREEFERGLNVTQMIHREDHERLSLNIRRKLSGESVHDSEYRGVRKDGTVFPVLIYSDIILHNGSILGLRGIVVDITERKRREQEKETLIELLHLINATGNTSDLLREVLPFLRSVAGCDLVSLKLNCEISCPFCRSADASSGPPELLHGSECQWIAASTPSAGDSSETCFRPCRIVDCDCMGAAITQLSERGSAWCNRVKDVKLEAPGSAKDACGVVTSGGDGFDSAAAVTLRAGKKNVGVLQLKARQADHFSPEKISFIEEMGDSIAVALAQRQAEEEHLRLNAALEQAAEVIVITDTEGNIQYVNPSFERVYGYSREEVLHKNPRMLKSGRHDKVFYRAMWTTIAGGSVWRGQFVNRKKDGSLLEEEATISPVRDDRGRIINYVAVKRDVTRERSLQAQLRQSQKMEALGTLAGGIAHDFNNILMAVMGYAELTRYAPTEVSRVLANAEQIIKASERARELVRHILAFSRGSEQERKPMDLAPVIKEALNLLRASLPATIEVKYAINSGRHTVMADATQVHQVLMNLCTNASHAMRESGGVLHVTLDPVVLGGDGTGTPAHLPAGEYLQLTVRDSGHGMDSETLTRIFDPYFSTKPKGVGTGMGLSVVHGIVKSHGGAVTVESEPGKGATFKVYFPVERLREEAQENLHSVERLHMGHERILLVDDEAALLDVGAQILRTLGYRVETAKHAQEALDLFRQDPDAFDVVITDMTMPFMTGLELSRTLLQLRPNLPIVLCTGYSELITKEKSRSAGVLEFIEKPFVIKDLSSAVRRALESADRKARDAVAV